MSFNNRAIPADAVAVTKSDATVLDLIGLYVGTTGDVAVSTPTAASVVFKAVPAGGQIALHIIKVLSTGTTASDIVGFKGDN